MGNHGDELAAVKAVQEKTRWRPSWWAVALVSLLMGFTFALIRERLLWAFLAAVVTFTLWWVLRKKLQNPFVYRDPHFIARNDRATWARVLTAPISMFAVMVLPDGVPMDVLAGILCAIAFGWMLYENRNVRTEGVF